jgi:enoyl-CoA hydratase
MPEINVGLAGGVSMLRTLFGRSFTRRMFYTGMRVSAAEMYRRGVLDEVLPPDQLMPAALKLAQEIASKSPVAISYAKQAANMMDLMPQRDGYRFEQNFTMALSRTEDAKEARMAFLEKRAPVYKGK